MKYFIALLPVLFFVSCGENSDFASLGEKNPALVQASDSPSEEIKKLVEDQDDEDKSLIGEQAAVVPTLGKKDLSREKDKEDSSNITYINVEQEKIVVRTKDTIQQSQGQQQGTL